MYTLYKFHFLNGISEINQLFDDILIIWPAPVYLKDLSDEHFVRTTSKLSYFVQESWSPIYKKTVILNLSRIVQLYFTLTGCLLAYCI